MPRKTPKKHPSNIDIMAELQSLHSVVESLPGLAKDVADLKQWRRDTEIAKSAVQEYVKGQPQQGSDQWLNRELIKTLIIALGIIASLVALSGRLVK